MNLYLLRIFSTLDSHMHTVTVQIGYLMSKTWEVFTQSSEPEAHVKGSLRFIMKRQILGCNRTM